LNQLIKLTKTGDDVVEDEGSPQVDETVVVEPSASPAPNEATEAEVAVANEGTGASELASEGLPAPNKATDDDPVGRALASFRARNGVPEPGTRLLDK
jgi:hypothetical protein